MPAFYDNLTPEDVETLDRLARLLLELRESRRELLARHGAVEEAELLERIRRGELPEHPAYEDYLGARLIAATRETIRVELKDYMLQLRPR